MSSATSVLDTKVDNSPKLGREAAAYTLGGALQLLATLLAFPLMTRVLSDEQFGLAVTLQLIAQLCVHIGSAGLPLATMREFFDADGGQDRSKRLILTSSVTALTAASFIAATSRLWITVFDSVTLGTAIWLAIAVTVPRSVTASALGHLRARHAVRPFLAISITNTVGAQLVGIAIAASFDQSASNFIAGYLIGSVVAAAWSWITASRPTAFLRGPALRRVFRYALPTVAHALATLVLSAGDRIVIETVLGLSEVGRYQIAYLLASLPVHALIAFNNAWSPRLAAANEAGQFLKALQGPANTLLITIPCLGAACALVSPTLISIGLPDSYDAADLRVPIAVISSVALSFAVYVIATQALIIERRTLVLAIVTPSAAVINIVLNTVLVPRHGLTGAAIATSITYVAMAGVLTVLARRLHRYRLSGIALALGAIATLYGALTTIIAVSGLAGILLRFILLAPLAAVTVAAIRRSRSAQILRDA